MCGSFNWSFLWLGSGDGSAAAAPTAAAAPPKNAYEFDERASASPGPFLLHRRLCKRDRAEGMIVLAYIPCSRQGGSPERRKPASASGRQLLQESMDFRCPAELTLSMHCDPALKPFSGEEPIAADSDRKRIQKMQLNWSGSAIRCERWGLGPDPDADRGRPAGSDTR